MSSTESSASASPRQFPRNGPGGVPRSVAPLVSPQIRHSASSTRSGATASPTRGSMTQTMTNSSDRSESPETLVLRLRGAHDASSRAGQGHRRRITWAEDVIDNEGLGRKSSKVCCIYHRTREVGESSDESSSESDSSSSDDDNSDSPDDGSARRVGGDKRGHLHGKGCKHSNEKKKPSPNAYERMPKYTKERLVIQRS